MEEIRDNKSDSTCDICFRIACKMCSWIATDVEVEQIQAGLLSSCPVCGWKPEEN